MEDGSVTHTGRKGCIKRGIERRDAKSEQQMT